MNLSHQYSIPSVLKWDQFNCGEKHATRVSKFWLLAYHIISTSGVRIIHMNCPVIVNKISIEHIYRSKRTTGILEQPSYGQNLAQLSIFIFVWSCWSDHIISFTLPKVKQIICNCQVTFNKLSLSANRS